MRFINYCVLHKTRPYNWIQPQLFPYISKLYINYSRPFKNIKRQISKTKNGFHHRGGPRAISPQPLLSQHVNTNDRCEAAELHEKSPAGNSGAHRSAFPARESYPGSGLARADLRGTSLTWFPLLS